MSDALTEEFEVLEAIYPAELSKLSDRDLQIDVEPDDTDILEGDDSLRLTLHVHYTDDYPDSLPELSIPSYEGDLDPKEKADLLSQLHAVGEENIGMAMTFTLVSHLREQLSELVRIRIDRKQKEEMEIERKALEEEEARTRGTPVTLESFKAWKARFDQEIALKRVAEEEEKLKGLTPKERDEFRRMNTRPSGRQLFERNKNLEDESLLEEGATSVDLSQYSRDQRNVQDEDDNDDRVTFSDSD